jgi:beta-glucosidase
MNDKSNTLSRKNFLTMGITMAALLALPKVSWAQDIILTGNDADRIEELLAQMTLEEKCVQLASQFPNANVRLGIPNMVTGECLHGLMYKDATMFPQAIALGSTWDTDLIERIGTVIAIEARALGFHQCYAPMLGVLRDPRWGRSEECYGEDPHLVSRIGVAFINGLQGKDRQRFDQDHIMATAKHYLADSQPEAGANGAAMDVSEYTLRTVYLPPFRAAVQEAHVGSIMPAHHSLNGVPCHANQHILVEILRKELGFDGIIVSDNNDIKHLNDYLKYAGSTVEAAKLALEATVDMELIINAVWAEKKLYGPPLVEAVKAGAIPVQLVDNAVKRVLKAKIMLGLFEDKTLIDKNYDILARGYNEKAIPTNKEKDLEDTIKFKLFNKPKPGAAGVLKSPGHRALALESARKAIILLKNKNDLLPVNKQQIKNIAVIGPNANEVVMGGYSVPSEKYTSIFEGIKRAAGAGVTVRYTEGCNMLDNSTKGFEPAMNLAKAADVVVLALGQSRLVARENLDRDDLTLTGGQQQLVENIVSLGKKVIVVLLHCQPLAINWISEHVDAIIDGWYLGQETGNAIADVIFGQYNPGGKLTVTYPRNVGQVPCYYNQLPLSRARNLFQADKTPLFPFGFGLSYTQFSFSDPVLSENKIKPDGTTTATVKVTNTGKVAGDEVVQLYLSAVYSKPVRPVKELKGFQRITLKAGQSTTVSFKIGPEVLECWNDGWMVSRGQYQIMIGNSSVNTKNVGLTVI